MVNSHCFNNVGPNNTLEFTPEICQPTKDCQLKRLQTLFNTCSRPQGIYEPIPCAPGFYCPEGGRQQLHCPVGHYCPLGSYRPWRCNSISACPPDSSRQFPLVGLVAFLIIDVLIIVGAGRRLIRGFWHSWRKPNLLQFQQDREKQSQSAPVDLSQEVEELQMPSDDMSFSLNQFVKSVQRCIQLSEIGLEIGFDNLGFQIGAESKSILDGVSGVVKPGSLLAVMGASGAGKCK